MHSSNLDNKGKNDSFTTDNVGDESFYMERKFINFCKLIKYLKK